MKLAFALGMVLIAVGVAVARGLRHVFEEIDNAITETWSDYA